VFQSRLKNEIPRLIFVTFNPISRLIQVFVMKNIFLLIHQIWNKFFNFINNNSFRRERIFIMKCMKLFRILQVNLKNTPLSFNL